MMKVFVYRSDKASKGNQLLSDREGRFYTGRENIEIKNAPIEFHRCILYWCRYVIDRMGSRTRFPAGIGAGHRGAISPDRVSSDRSIP